MRSKYVVDLREVQASDVGCVGGKNASLGEMIRALQPLGINVPPGFATTAQAYWDFLEGNRLREPIQTALARLEAGKLSLATASKTIRGLFAQAEFPPELAMAMSGAYRRLCTELDIAGKFLKSGHQGQQS